MKPLSRLLLAGLTLVPGIMSSPLVEGATVPERIVLFRNSDGNTGIWGAATRTLENWQTGLITDDPTQTQGWGWFGITHGFMADINGDRIDDKVMIQPGIPGGGPFSGHQAIVTYSAENDISSNEFDPVEDVWPVAGGEWNWLETSEPFFADVDGDNIDDFGVTATEDVVNTMGGNPDVLVWGAWKSDGVPGISRNAGASVNFTGWGAFGVPSLGDVPLFGDINGDGFDDRILHRTSTREVFVDYSEPDGTFGDGSADLGPLPVGDFGDKISTSDINGDGLDDLVLIRELPDWEGDPVYGTNRLFGYYTEETSPGEFEIDTSTVDIETLFGQVNNDGGWLSPDNMLFGQLELPPTPDCDFDGMNGCDGDDINLLMAAIAGGMDPPEFDLNGDNEVNLLDRDQWLLDAGMVNIGAGYLVADFNLDGTVDGQDFIDWNSNKFTTNTDWTAGNANGDNTVDGQDFIDWNSNKFMSSVGGINAVPEPHTWPVAVLLVMYLTRRARRGSLA